MIKEVKIGVRAERIGGNRGDDGQRMQTFIKLDIFLILPVSNVVSLII